jgi:signal recognition particle GTPase
MNEDDIKLLEYFDKKWEESLDKQDDRLSGYVEQSAKLQDNLNILAEAHKELDAAYAAGDINAADYVEGLRGVRDQILENLEAYEDLKKTISELYTDTLDMIDEKVERQTDHITAASEAMASYITLLGLMGRGKNFRELEQFYQK